jgi:branched-chain amino acid transport system permease protein
VIEALSVPIAAFMLQLRDGEFATGMWIVAALCHLLVNLDNLVQVETGTSLIAQKAYAADDRRSYAY